MAKKIGSVRTPDGPIPYDVYWDPESGEVKVAIELAGSARTEEEAMNVARHYATHGKKNFFK